MNETIQNTMYRGAEDFGAIIGVPVGIISGTLEAALLPSYIRGQLGNDEPHQAGYGFPRNNIHDVESAIEEVSSNQKPNERFRTELSSRFLGNVMGMALGVGNITRWIVTIAAAIDLSDGRPEHLGYLAIPSAMSLVYEGVRYLRNKNNSQTQTNPAL